ncbi:MAG: serine/threonine-protein kinase [Pirellulales bacterium]
MVDNESLVDDLVDQALADYLRRVDRGEIVDEGAFLAAYPAIAQSLDSYFRTAAMVEQMAGLRGTDSVAAAAAPESTCDSANQSRPVPADDRAAPRQLGRYQIIRRLGKGGMGVVYLADDPALRRQVAVKVPRFRPDDDPEVVTRFFREAQAAASVQHRNICPVFDICESDGMRFITMAYVDGRPLSDYVHVGRGQNQRKVAILVRKLALALHEAHRLGIVHRDLKPANILIDSQHEPVIMDFGIARMLHAREDARLTRTGQLIGSPAYMSPEQLSGDPSAVGPASDIFSLGVVCYELLAGRRPFDGEFASVVARIMTEDAPSIRKVRPDIDSTLGAICQRMLQRNAAHRFGSMREVGDALASWLRSSPNAGEVGPFEPPGDQGLDIGAAHAVQPRPPQCAQESRTSDTITLFPVATPLDFPGSQLEGQFQTQPAGQEGDTVARDYAKSTRRPKDKLPGWTWVWVLAVCLAIVCVGAVYAIRGTPTPTPTATHPNNSIAVASAREGTNQGPSEADSAPLVTNESSPSLAAEQLAPAGSAAALVAEETNVEQPASTKEESDGFDTARADSGIDPSGKPDSRRHNRQDRRIVRRDNRHETSSENEGVEDQAASSEEPRHDPAAFPGKVTLVLTGVTPRQVMQLLEKNFGMTLHYDADEFERCDVPLDQPYRLEVRNGSIDDLLQGAFGPIEVRFALQQRVLTLWPAKAMPPPGAASDLQPSEPPENKNIGGGGFGGGELGGGGFGGGGGGGGTNNAGQGASPPGTVVKPKPRNGQQPQPSNKGGGRTGRRPGLRKPGNGGGLSTEGQGFSKDRP